MSIMISLAWNLSLPTDGVVLAVLRRNVEQGRPKPPSPKGVLPANCMWELPSRATGAIVFQIDKSSGRGRFVSNQPQRHLLSTERK